MNQREFCYWLQGYFELKDDVAESPQPLNASQVSTIRQHLELVKEADKQKLSGFCAWMDFMLEELLGEKDIVSYPRDARIRAKLASEFEHVIDKSYEGDQEKFNKIHRPPHPGNDKDVVFRC